VVSADPRDAREPSAGAGGLPVPRALLRELSRPSAARALAMIAFLLAAAMGLGLAATLVQPWWARVPIWLAAGFFVNGLVQLGHDAWHHNVFARPWQNTLFGHLFSLLYGVSFSAARHAHLRHHWYNRTERDPDAYNAGARGPRVQVQFYAVVFLGLSLAPLHFNVLYPLVAYSRRELVRHAAELVGYVLAWGLLVKVLPLGLLLDAWLLPLLFANPWNGLKSIADHHANVWRGDRFHAATTVRTTAFWTFAWNGLNHHLDHHLFPRVPGYNLPRLHALIAPELAARGAPVFDGYLGVFRDALRAGPTYVEDGHAFLRRREAA
jgi:fatty acid desaturase